MSLKTKAMKKLLFLFTLVVSLLLFVQCDKKSDSSSQTYTFSIDSYTNPTDPTLLHVTYEDGTQVTYSGTKDAAGNPVKIQNVTVKYPDMEGNFLISLDANSLPARQLTPNGTVFEYTWNNDTTLRLKAISPDGQVQVSIPINLKGAKSYPVYGDTGKPENIRKNIPGKFAYKEYHPGEMRPLKPVTDNAMIFHVRKCGVDVTNATVVLNVTPPLGVSAYPCANIGNGFYSTNIPKSGEPPANYEQTCDKVGTIAKDVCDTYNLISVLPANVSVQVCQLLSDKIAEAFPGNASGDKIKAMCGKAMGALDALCKFAEKNNIAELCKLANLLYTEPKGGYSFTVTVTVPGSAACTPGSQSFDPANPQTYMVDMGGTFDINNLYTDPADPGPKQGYSAYADVICPDPGGTSVTISVLGSDGYSNSYTNSFTSNGQIRLDVPGGAQSVRDVITVTSGTISKSISIVF